MKKKATFITIEGLEGSGKSSVINFLKTYLESRQFSVRIFREPGSTYIGEKIRAILLDRRNKELTRHTELLLYLAARTQLIEEMLTDALLKYDFVICDRFFDSTIVYQGHALGLGDIVDKSVKMFALGMVPDLTLVLDTEPQEGLARIPNKDRIELRPITFHNKLRKGYLELAAKNPKRIKVVDAGGKLEDIYPRVEAILKNCVKKLR